MSKKVNQQKYKDMLDQQLEINNQFKMYGNMTSVEKAMNRHDLQAYKNYDTREYSLVPGVSHNKNSSLMVAANVSLSPKKKLDVESKYQDKLQ